MHKLHLFCNINLHPKIHSTNKDSDHNNYPQKIPYALCSIYFFLTHLNFFIPKQASTCFCLL